MYQTNPQIVPALPSFISGRLENRRLLAEKSRRISSIEIADSRYTVKIARTNEELEEILRLRYQIFKVELGREKDDARRMEKDAFDSTSHHLVAVENSSNRIVGGYRLRAAEFNGKKGFYSNGEFKLNDLPDDITEQSVEIGRACIASAHRNGKVLFLLWRGLAQYLREMKKRYIFGCCSLFSNDYADGIKAFNRLKMGGFLHETIRVAPQKFDFRQSESLDNKEFDTVVELPKLFQTYLRIGTKVCSQPIVDAEFGTIDFFVLFDALRINEKYRKMFFAE